MHATMGEVPSSGQIETSMGMLDVLLVEVRRKVAKREPESVRTDEIEATWCGYTID